MTCNEIRDDREFYEAVREYTSRLWEWGAIRHGEDESERTPDELIELLNKRIAWVQAHKKAVDHYLRRRSGPTWVRVIDGSSVEPSG